MVNKERDPREETVGRNVVAMRGNMSQQALAEVMRDRGHKWSQATVWSVEKGERPLRLMEAKDLADIFGSSVVSLFAPSEERELIDQLFQELVSAQKVRNNLGLNVEAFVSVKGNLKMRLNRARAFGLERLEEALPGFHVTIAEADRIASQPYKDAIEEYMEERFGDSHYLLKGLGEDESPTDNAPGAVVGDRAAKSGRFGKKGGAGGRASSGEHPETS
ncbi:hypothetical protein [Ornithinimicrobium ciconiae]|uniref:hypothetical protein n=1 Tax=Ornithinimicrobium ciconiae TaxID=2594265 RepID=UPI001D1943BB|nr:hypothetical protein [Ornithinimicrobium ciconiae]